MAVRRASRNRPPVESNAADITVPGVRKPSVVRAARRFLVAASVPGGALLRRYGDAAVVAIVPLAIYLLSMSSYPDGWDTGEMQTVPYMLGITHPTGFPLFVLSGWVFSHVVAISTVAWRMNFFCALSIVVAVLSVRALAIGFGASRLLASLAALLFALIGAVWTHAIHADVQALAVAFIMTSIVALQRALVERSARWLTLSAALVACGIAVHLTAIFLSVTLLVAAIALHRHLSRADWLRGLAAFAIPLLTYLYLPIRSQMVLSQHLDPNEGLPLANTFGVDWGQFPINSWSGFYKMMTGQSLAQQYGWLAINPWHWPGFAADWLSRIQAEVSVVVVTLALLGLIVVAVKRPIQLIVVAAGFAAVPYAIAFGSIESDVMRYLLPSLATAVALAAVAPKLVEAGMQRRLAVAAFALILAVTGYSEYSAHRGYFGYHDGRANQDAIDIVRDHTPDGAVIVCSWVDLTTLGYGKYIDKSLGSRYIVGGWPSDMIADFRALAQAHQVYVLADFVEKPNLVDHVPRAWQHTTGSWPGRDLVLIIPSQ